MAKSGDAGGSKASRSAPVEISGGHNFRQSGSDGGGSKASRDLTSQGITITGGGHLLGSGKRDGDAGGEKGRGG